MKFSVIVPVYNTSEYLEECLLSIQNQTYKNFEVIVIDDGSSDDSYLIMEKFANKDDRFKIYKKKNEGVSVTRNMGVSKATGDYIVFVDSDDTINIELLNKLNDVITYNKDIDLVKYNLKFVNSDKEIVCSDEFSELKGEEAFLKLYVNSLFVCPVGYAYKRSFWISNKFKYAEGRVHEDYGLTPYIILCARKVSAINFDGYNYYVRENSIMTDNSKEKLIKKNEDSLYHFDFLLSKKDEIKDAYVKRIFVSYISYALINRCSLIKDRDMLNSYLGEIKKRNVGKYLINDSIPRKIKKLIFKISPSLFIKLFVK